MRVENCFQAQVIRWLLGHSPQSRPTSVDLLQSPLIPLKIVDRQLQEACFLEHPFLSVRAVHSPFMLSGWVQVVSRTLSNPSSTLYKQLINDLFSREESALSERTYFLDSQDSKTFSSIKVKGSDNGLYLNRYFFFS